MYKQPVLIRKLVSPAQLEIMGISLSVYQEIAAFLRGFLKQARLVP